MNILYLGMWSTITQFLIKNNYVEQTTDPITNAKHLDCIVSYGYRHKIPMGAVSDVGGRAVNLHISYLPYNRGANPNYWSWYDNTPKGVSIHYVDDGFDTGDIILQKQVDLNPTDTLRKTYKILSIEIESLFIDNWDHIFSLPRYPQHGGGTVHKSSDKMDLPNGWDTRCDDIEEEVFGWDI